MSDQPRPTPIKPGDTVESKHVYLMITTLRQLRAAHSAEAFACDGVLCVCDGDDDCIDMFDGDDCGPDAACWSDESGLHCVCIQ